MKNPIMEEPAAVTNWRMCPRTRKFAETLAVQRLMDGEARSELQGLAAIKCPFCGTAKDHWWHWMFRCEAIKEVREKEWTKIAGKLGIWIREIGEFDMGVLAAGRFPRRVWEFMLKKRARG